MRYEYKRLNVDNYIDSLYIDGFSKSDNYTKEQINSLISTIGIFKFKGYVKAFRKDVSRYSIDDIINLYNADRDIALKMFELSSKIEIKLKAYFIDAVYEMSSNPFCYLIQSNYKDDFTINKESVYDWEVKANNKQKSEVYLHYRDYYLSKYDFESNKKEYLSNKELIPLEKTIDINYPPFHYFIENSTLGAVIKILSKLYIDDIKILKTVANKFGIYNERVFLNYLLRLKEIRNRCAHNGRLFNRNYRGVKSSGKHSLFRKDIYEHKLIDVYFSISLLLEDTKRFDNINILINCFENEILKNADKNSKKFILDILRQGKCASRDLP